MSIRIVNLYGVHRIVAPHHPDINGLGFHTRSQARNLLKARKLALSQNLPDAMVRGEFYFNPNYVEPDPIEDWDDFSEYLDDLYIPDHLGPSFTPAPEIWSVRPVEGH